MGIRTQTVFATVLIVSFLQGCASVYIPNAHHTHQLDKKGELSAAVYAGSNGVDAQVAYAFSDRWGVLGAASFGTNEEVGEDDYHEHSYTELGVEYFKPFWDAGRFELIGGGGIGTASSVTTYDFIGPNTVQATGRYNKLFIQSNVGVETNLIEAGVALRLGHVAFTEFETSSRTYDESETGTFFEPAAFARLGWKNIKIEAQAGTSYPLQDESDIAFDHRFFLMTLGLHFTF